MSGRVLVAGIGNVFLGDDGFGVEVVQRLQGGQGGGEGTALPDGVDVVDYGIRGVHLAYDLLDGEHDVVVLVDALPLPDPPGTLAVLEVPMDGGTGPDPPAVDGHGMTPHAVVELLKSLGGGVQRVLVVGCRPAVVDERMELSAPVAAAVEPAVAMVTDVVRELATAGAHQ